MKIGILVTGPLPERMVELHGTYFPIFTRFLQRADPTVETFGVDVAGGDPLPAPEDADGWLITGSRFGVYEPLPWMEPLKKFCRDAIAARVPIVGVCFGHQILAEALGGAVVKSEKGWALGVQSYAPAVTPDWLPDGLKKEWAGHVIHQDQVIRLPDNATVMATSDFCPYAALAFGDPDKPLAISMQAHPEYDDRSFRDISATRLRPVLGDALMDDAEASLGQPTAGDAWAEAAIRYFRMFA